MKKMCIIFFMMLVPCLMLNAAIEKCRSLKIEKGSWLEKDRRDSLPIEATIEDNVYVLIYFLQEMSHSTTFQLKDDFGNVVYQNVLVPRVDMPLYIDISNLEQGTYQLIYTDGESEWIGEFQKERTF